MTKFIASPATAVALFVAMLGMVLSFFFLYPVGFLYATYENLYGEWSQFFCFLGSAILFALIAHRWPGRRWMFVLLTLACFYVAMEEISWGQQLFSWKSPAAFKANNLQGETNLHNFFTGPYNTLLKEALTFTIALAMVTYGFLLPLINRYSATWRRRFARFGLVVAPLYVAPFFIAAAVFEMEFLHFNEAEFAELFVGAGLLMTAVHYRAALRQPGVPARSKNTHNAEMLLTPLNAEARPRVLLAAVSVLLCAVLVTQGMYSTERGKRKIDNRIENGIDKYAGRYEKRDMDSHALDLYEQYLALNSDSPARMRKVIRMHRKMGNEQQANEMLQQALAIDLKKFEKEPWRASVQRSLMRSYKLAGDDAKLAEHTALALAIGHQRVRDKPNSASAAYSLGRTLDLLDRNREAAQLYQRAYELRPTKSSYRKAYLKSR